MIFDVWQSARAAGKVSFEQSFVADIRSCIPRSSSACAVGTFANTEHKAARPKSMRVMEYSSQGCTISIVEDAPTTGTFLPYMVWYRHMKKDLHPESYRLVIFEDVTAGKRFLIGST